MQGHRRQGDRKMVKREPMLGEFRKEKLAPEVDVFLRAEIGRTFSLILI